MMLVYYITHVGIYLALIVILVVAWPLSRRAQVGAGIWLKFCGALLLVLVRSTDAILFEPFVGVLRPDATNVVMASVMWSRIFAVGITAGFLLFATGEALLHFGAGHRRLAGE